MANAEASARPLRPAKETRRRGDAIYKRDIQAQVERTTLERSSLLTWTAESGLLPVQREWRRKNCGRGILMPGMCGWCELAIGHCAASGPDPCGGLGDRGRCEPRL